MASVTARRRTDHKPVTDLIVRPVRRTGPSLRSIPVVVLSRARSRSCAVGGLAALLALTVAVPGGPAAAEPTDARIVPISRTEALQRPVLRPGALGLWVRRLHRALGITPAAQPFGDATATAVRSFRAAHGLRPDALVNARMWLRLGSLVKVGQGRRAKQPPPVPAAPAAPTLRRGDTSAWVSVLQSALGVQPNTGYFGPITLAAVEEFQGDAGLPVTGVVDAATWQALGSRVTAPQTDVTTTTTARTSEAHRASIGVSAFADSETARKVVQRESNGQCDVVSPGGTYRGKWQMDSAFWVTYGGPKYASTPDRATCEQQDAVAYRGWIDRWWQPWPTAA